MRTRTRLRSAATRRRLRVAASRRRFRVAAVAASLTLLAGLLLATGLPSAEGVPPSGPAATPYAAEPAPAAGRAGVAGADRAAAMAALHSRHAHAHAHPAGFANDTLRLEGEFGLWARFEDDSLRVSWITRNEAAGFLELALEGGEAHPAGARSAKPRSERSASRGEAARTSGGALSFQTPAGISHTVSVPVPEAESVLLTYGSQDDPEDRHRTRVWLEEAPPGAAPVHISGVDSLYVIGDIHGEYDNMIHVLRNAGVIDDSLRWSAGRAHLVVLGDMMSRGRHATGVLWFLYGLERQAAEAGGRMHTVLGNHELMVMIDDLRYVRHKELRIAELHGTGYARMYDPRHSVLGRWLTGKPGAIRVDEVLLAHGGVSDDYRDVTLESHRDSLAAYVREDLFYHWLDTTVVISIDSVAFERRLRFFWGDRSVFWYRGYAQSDTLAAELESVLGAHESELHVVAHTPVPTMREAYGGSLVLVNTIDFATELLLLVRGEAGYERLRYRLWGPPEPL